MRPSISRGRFATESSVSVIARVPEGQSSVRRYVPSAAGIFELAPAGCRVARPTIASVPSGAPSALPESVRSPGSAAANAET